MTALGLGLSAYFGQPKAGRGFSHRLRTCFFSGPKILLWRKWVGASVAAKIWWKLRKWLQKSMKSDYPFLDSPHPWLPFPAVEPRGFASLVHRLPCGLRVLDQIDWWEAAREATTAGKRLGQQMVSCERKKQPNNLGQMDKNPKTVRNLLLLSLSPVISEAKIVQFRLQGPFCRLRALLQSGGCRFYDADSNFVKTPMVALVAVGGLPLSCRDGSLELRLGEMKVPVSLENLRGLACAASLLRIWRA